MTAGIVYGIIFLLSAILAVYLIARGLKARNLAGGDEFRVPPGGIQLGRRFNPETGYLDSVETDEGLNPNPITTSDTLKETLEAQNKSPRP